MTNEQSTMNNEQCIADYVSKIVNIFLGRVGLTPLTLDISPPDARLIERQDYAEVRAWGAGRFQTDSSTVRFNDALGDRQSQPCAALFAVTHERFEESLADLNRDSWAVVGHSNVRFPIKFYRHERNQAAARHRLDRIVE